MILQWLVATRVLSNDPIDPRLVGPWVAAFVTFLFVLRFQEDGREESERVKQEKARIRRKKRVVTASLCSIHRTPAMLRKSICSSRIKKEGQ